MKVEISRHWFAVCLLILLNGAVAGRAAAPATRNVFLITTDGLRWQEVFRGMEEFPLTREFGNSGNTNTLRALFWRDTPEARRAALFPFLWGTLAKEGQIWGNRDLGSEVRVSNGQNFSYPGYNEFLTGYADPRIDSNDKKLNVNTNVFEWLNSRPEFRGRVAAVINWDVLPWVLNGPRSGLPIWSGFDVPPGTTRLTATDSLAEMVEHGRTVWSGVLLDTFVGYAARHTVRSLKPRALYVSYGETDDWAHEGNYERYLKAAHEFDRFLAGLWTLTQSLPEYRGSTTFVITVDHGRGSAPVAWRSHGKEIPESAYIWVAVLGPDTPALGERSKTPLMIQNQIAATVASFVGEDYHAAFPRTGARIPGVMKGDSGSSAGN